jgi:hypothetical protein
MCEKSLTFPASQRLAIHWPVVERQRHHRLAIDTMHPERVPEANLMQYLASLASWRKVSGQHHRGEMIERARVEYDHRYLGTEMHCCRVMLRPFQGSISFPDAYRWWSVCTPPPAYGLQASGLLLQAALEGQRPSAHQAAKSATIAGSELI